MATTERRRRRQGVSGAVLRASDRAAATGRSWAGDGRAERARLGCRSRTDETELGWRDATNLAIAAPLVTLLGAKILALLLVDDRSRPLAPAVWHYAPAVWNRLSSVAIEEASERSRAGWLSWAVVSKESLAPRPKVENVVTGKMMPIERVWAIVSLSSER
ncbi:hypothetical protein QBC39DRAFT_334785 [Podospora conica]|nr:hypothetical protein QBC39DRAFT_334785 [Schizothecium conicum]